ncbi:MAG TPA: 4Fe-4S binding protein [Clostridia bacterium]
MSKSNLALIKRGIWYIAGFFLLYAPFAFFQRFLTGVFRLSGRSDIHGACFRMVVQGLTSGKGLNLLTTSGIIVLLIFIISFLAGPLFCGKLCTVGAIPEYASRLVPDRFKIDLQKYIPSNPVRYGLLAGFFITPALGLSVVCAYCNYSFMEKLVLGGINLDIGILGSSTILTGFIWFFLLGVFTKGGRGYCSYLCPIGAVQNLIHRVGLMFPFTYKLKLSRENCISCGICTKECPKRALNINDSYLTYNVHSCITCSQCIHVCPKKALFYGSGKANWSGVPEKEKDSSSKGVVV